MLPFALHGYCISVRTSTRATPFSLIYGMDAVLPVEMEIPSLRILTYVKLDEAEWVQARFNQLNLIDEKRLETICYGQLYQKHIKKARNKKVLPRNLEVGDLILRKIMPIQTDPNGQMDGELRRPIRCEKSFL